MALISMASYCTDENNRAGLLKRTLDSLLETVDFTRHRIFIAVNASTEESAGHLISFQFQLPTEWRGDALIYLPENIGTARAVNLGWKHRQPGEMCVKMDDDVVIHRAGWVDEMEEAISRDSKIGIIGLKRKDLWETPWHPNPEHRGHLRMLPHEAGQKWIIVEDVNHVMGTCQAYSAALLERIGYLYQPRLYGFDDSLAAIRCKVAGFTSCFLHGYEIDHIDPGGDAYTQHKRNVAGEDSAEYHRIKAGYLNGTIGIYYDADGNNKPVEVDGAVPGYQWRIPKYNTR